MTPDLLLKIVDAFVGGCCTFAKTMQANPVGAFVLLAMTVLAVTALWLQTRPPAASSAPKVRKSRLPAVDVHY
jgi:hypothetical protein